MTFLGGGRFKNLKELAEQAYGNVIPRWLRKKMIFLLIDADLPILYKMNSLNEDPNIIQSDDSNVDNGLSFHTWGEEVEHILGLRDSKAKTIFNYLNQPRDLLDFKTQVVLDTLSQKRYMLGFRQAHLLSTYYTLYLYSDIVQHSFVGDTYSQLLRTVEVPYNTKWGQQIVIKYDSPHYMPVAKSFFDTIEIDLKNDLNQTLPFEFGLTIVKLHFRKDD